MIIDGLVGEGNYFAAANVHAAGRISDLFRDDPRYPALLQQAGITW